MAEYRKLSTAERERMARHILTKVHADQSTMVNNIIDERRSSRRCKVRQFNCDGIARKTRIRQRLLYKLAIRELVAMQENLTQITNERKTKEENVEDLGRGTSETKGQSAKAQKVLST